MVNSVFFKIFFSCTSGNVFLKALDSGSQNNSRPKIEKLFHVEKLLATGNSTLNNFQSSHIGKINNTVLRNKNHFSLVLNLNSTMRYLCYWRGLALREVELRNRRSPRLTADLGVDSKPHNGTVYPEY